MNIETWFNTEDVKRYYFPGRIFVGVGLLDKAVTLCQEAGESVAVVADKAVYDMPFVHQALAALNASVTRVMLVQGAPIAQSVEEFVQELGAPPAVVLAIGGGSATDFAKAVVASFLFGSIDGVGLRGNVPQRQLGSKPVLVCVPTTAGSGAEASRYYVTYDRIDHHKVFGKSWQLVADWIMLDPAFLRSMPEPVLVSCAFDVFVHLFETLVCQHERSWMGEMFSVNGIPRLMEALAKVVHDQDRSDSVLGALMETATLGGVAISNVRTGSIHEAAGALLEVTNLSHPETLFVFFRDAIEQYLANIRDREALLISQLRLGSEFSEFTSMSDVIAWWEQMFARVGLDKKIRAAVSELKSSYGQVRDHVFQRIYTDKVWVTKESPLPLSEGAIRSLIDRSFTRFGLIG